MIRMARLTDYGIVVLQYFASHPDKSMWNARDLSLHTKLPLPTVSKILKLLTRKGFLTSFRGVNGGYGLSRKPEEISVAQIIAALEGPIAVTDCNISVGSCNQEPDCPVQPHWKIINQAIQTALEGVHLARMAQPTSGSVTPIPVWTGK